jgi:anion-transporting  ArsA/GET3 family ATPase
VYDEVVIDAPPTGRIASFLDVTNAMAQIAKGGPVAGQAEGVARLLHSEDTCIHLVTLLEALPVQETADAVSELTAADLRVGTVIVNRASAGFLEPAARAAAAQGEVDATELRSGLERAGVMLSDKDFAGLITETIEHSATLQAQDESATELDKVEAARLYLPALADGVDLGGLYELAAALIGQGVR